MALKQRLDDWMVLNYHLNPTNAVLGLYKVKSGKSLICDKLSKSKTAQSIKRVLYIFNLEL